MTRPPPGLDATLDLDGFTARVPGERFGVYSGWAAGFAVVWTFVTFCLLLVVSKAAWFNELPAAGAMSVVFCLFGWMPAWPGVDAVLARWSGQRIVADGHGVTVDERRVLWEDVEGLGEIDGAIVVELRGGDLLLIPIGGAAEDERVWLIDQLAVLHGSYDHDGAAPPALTHMRTHVDAAPPLASPAARRRSLAGGAPRPPDG